METGSIQIKENNVNKRKFEKESFLYYSLGYYNNKQQLN